MRALKLYEQLKQLVDEGKITEETEVIATGEYSYGLDVERCYMSDMAHLNEETVVTPPQNTLCLYVDSYLCESEDVGLANLWVDTQDYNRFNEGVASNED